VQYKAKVPLFAYLEQPSYGLDILLDTFPDVINVYPTAALNIFDPAPATGLDLTANEKILELAEKTKNVHHLKNISNAQLAARLRTHTIFAYPNMLEQSSCTPMLNAMAAGLYIVTSNMGALPEYSVEHGKCILAKNLRSDSLDSFIGQVLAICQSQTHSPSAFYDYCFKQAMEMNKKHTWSVRAREWVNLLSNAS
jgi:glycosyltransferase involved in cell wall biosynthesis